MSKNTLIAALALCTAVALYIHVRWRRAPPPCRAMVAIALGCLAAGAILGASIEHFTAPDRAVDPIAQTVAIIIPAVAPADRLPTAGIYADVI